MAARCVRSRPANPSTRTCVTSTSTRTSRSMKRSSSIGSNRPANCRAKKCKALAHALGGGDVRQTFPRPRGDHRRARQVFDGEWLAIATDLQLQASILPALDVVLGHRVRDLIAVA